jgi:hypothetical protein
MIWSKRIGNGCILFAITCLTSIPLLGHIQEDPQNSQLAIRPSENGNATEVFISFTLADIHEVIDANQRIEMSLAVFVSWKDPSLALHH